jgi:hypothetical protein
VESVNFTGLASEPSYILPSETLKPFDAIAHLLNTTTRRQAATRHDPGTAEKAAATLIASILLNAGLDAGHDLVAVFERTIFATLQWIRATSDPIATIDELLPEFGPENRVSPLEVHRTTVAGMVPEMTRAEMDQVMGDQYVEQMQSLEDTGAKSPLVALAIDNTTQRVSTEHPNGSFSPVKVGGKGTWEDGFKYPTIMDTTHLLFVGCHHEDHYPKVKGRAPALPPAVLDLQEKVATVKRAGSRAAVIEGDRDYFKGDLFAAAGQGLFDPGADPRDWPRLVVPVKFGPEKERFTWDILLDDSQPAVFKDYIKCAPPPAPGPGSASGGMFEQDDDGTFWAPYACVALVGEWGKAKSQDLAEVREQAKEVQDGIEACDHDIEATETTYVEHLEEATGEEGKKPNYGKGAKRKKFHDEEDERLYLECYRLRDERNKWDEKKAALMLLVAFIAVSLRPGEHPAAHPNTFMALARDYRQRWGIENGFKVVKWAFLRKVRDTRPRRRQFNMMLGMLLCNYWHNTRLRELLESCRKVTWNKKNYDNRRPWIRRKLEKDMHDATTARGFLIRLLEVGLQSLIQKMFKGA